jgi:hypothetical protein
MTTTVKIVENPDVIVVEAVIVSDNVSVGLAQAAAINAGNSASDAADSAAKALISENNAKDSEDNAATSETNAAASETIATDALTAIDSFNDLYLGSKTADPTLDNDGDALTSGALYFNTTNSTMRVYTGTEWIATSGTPEAFIGTFEFTATAGQTVFPVAHSVGDILVSLNGVRMGSLDYSSDGTNVTLVVPSTALDEIVVIVFTTFVVADVYTKAESDALLETATQLNDGMIHIGNSSNQTSTANFDSIVDNRVIALAIALG